MADLNEPWARLVTLGSPDEIVPITGGTFSIGRSTGTYTSCELFVVVLIILLHVS